MVKFLLGKMLGSPIRCCTHIKHVRDGVLALTSNNIGALAGLGRRHYAKDNKDKGGCCKDIVQTEGRKVEPWPKSDPPPPAWRCECPRDPQPPNYDPYRIKVPDIVVPPLPPSNAKRTCVVYASTDQQHQGNQPTHHHQGYGWPQQEAPQEEEEKDATFLGILKGFFDKEVPNEDVRELFKTPEIGEYRQASMPICDLFFNSPMVHPDYWKDKPEKRMHDVVRDTLPKLGYHGKNKYKYAFHEPWKPLDRMGLLEQAEKEEVELDVANVPMLDCTRTKGPCSVKPVPDPPPCPPPPPPPFPWIYVWALTSFLGTMGLIYKLYLWKEEYDKVNDNVPIWRPRRRVKRPYHDMDLPPCVQYLIVGTGAAGWAAYRAIMEHDKTAKVFFVTKEDVMPYRRPPLSKNMWWNAEPPDVMTLNYLDAGKRTTMYLSECRKFMDPVKFYRKKTGPAVSIASGWCALRVDAENHILYIKTMCGEVPMYYERLLLALGSKAKNLGVFKSAPKSVRDKTTTFRTIRDLEIAYRKVKEAKHVVVLGAGVLGTELAWTLGRMNRTVERPEGQDPIEIVHMYKDKGILSGVIPEYLGEWAAEKIKCEGVKVMPKTQIYDAFETPDGRLELTLSNGSSLVTDYVIVAIGANPRDEMAEASFLETDPINGGIAVNTELEARTHLYVAGDAASFYSQWHGHRLRMEHYDNAEEQGYVAGANMAGYWLPCNMEPHYWLALGEALEMEVVGEVGACMPTVGIFKPCTMDEDAKREQEQLMKKVDGSGDRPCYKKTEEYQSRYKRGILFYLRDETVVGMLFWNLPPIEDRKEVVTEMLRARPSYKDINLLAELLGFPDTQCVYKSEDDLKLPGPCIKK